MTDRPISETDIQILCSSISDLIEKISKQSKLIEKLIEQPSINLDRLYVTKIEAAWLLGVSVRKVERMVKEGNLSTVRDSRSMMFSVEELRSLPLCRLKKDGSQFELNLKELR